jgi:hypothetical protein
LTVIAEKLSVVLLEIELENQPINYGLPLPDVYQQCAFAYTDFWQAYKTVIPAKQHRAGEHVTFAQAPQIRENGGMIPMHNNDS